MNIEFRNDQYGKNFCFEDESGFYIIPYRTGEFCEKGLDFFVSEEIAGDILKINISISAKKVISVKRLGMRLGIDCYMESYPQWNEKYFPTALRCEKNGFWSCFMSPKGKIISVCSPSEIVSWSNEYSVSEYDIVGHRIYTSRIDFINTYPQPSRHPESQIEVGNKPINIELYYFCLETQEQMYSFIEKYSGIHIPLINRYTLLSDEELILDGEKYSGKLSKGLNIINLENNAEVTVFVRKDWFYYLECAARSAEKCQQKPGTHCESWYGFFSRVLYAKEIGNKDYTESLCEEFDYLFNLITEKVDGKYRMREKTLPHRLQNSSALISLLADFYELTSNTDYLDKAGDLADFLIKLQADDGSYRRNGTHYTCVIYPAKSMLELALNENAAGYTDRYSKHFESAYKAIKNLELMLDNIETEGQQTFEDGMISCECLQLSYLALLLPEGEERTNLINAAEYIYKKHRCLQQQILPDCRVRGATLRFWEARYDLNFFANMMNTPHGWTSWKNYATYYLYMLTGKPEYIIDLMDTMGACMQCVDSDGVLHWGYIADPSVTGERLQKGSKRGDIKVEKVTVGECYLPMISDWWHQDEELILEFLHPWNRPEEWDKCYGGSCDNDVHEHFKCLVETVFAKAFIHQTADGFITYNCQKQGDEFICKDSHLKQWVVYSLAESEISLNGASYTISTGFNIIDV